MTRNLGRARARATRVAFFLSKDEQRSAKDLRFASDLRVGPLRPGKRAAKRDRIVIPPAARGGRYFVLACVDPGSDLRETKEGNNCAASRRLRVIGPNPLKVGFARDEANAVDHVFTTQGQSVFTLASDGTSYQLDASNEMQDQFASVRMTPVGGISPAPKTVVPRGGVLIEPAGRILGAEGGLLRIVPPDLPDGSRLIGFAAAGDGSEFHLYPARLRDGEIVIHVLETGIYGYGVVPAGASVSRATVSAASDLQLPASERSQFAQKAADLVRRQKNEEVAVLACDYFEATVLPRLRVAVKRGTRQQVTSLFHETLSIQRQVGLLGIEDPACMREVLSLFEQILTRLFNESHKRCTTAGGDPFAESAEMLSIARQALLLGVEVAPQDEFVKKLLDCLSFEYQIDFTSEHQTLTTGGWASSGSASGSGLRMPPAHPEYREQAASVPQPSVEFSSDCSGSFVNSNGTYRARNWLFAEERYVGRFVNGRYKPDAEVKTEWKLKVRWSNSLIANFRIDCGGGESLWDLAGDHDSAVILPGRGGTATTTVGSLEPASDCVECERSTATVTVQVVPN